MCIKLVTLLWGSRYCLVDGCFKRGNVSLCFPAGGKFHGYLSDYQLRKDKYAVSFLRNVIYAVNTPQNCTYTAQYAPWQLCCNNVMSRVELLTKISYFAFRNSHPHILGILMAFCLRPLFSNLLYFVHSTANFLLSWFKPSCLFQLRTNSETVSLSENPQDSCDGKTDNRKIRLPRADVKRRGYRTVFWVGLKPLNSTIPKV
jgi:hypothetical protein